MVARKPPNKLAARAGSGDVSQNLGYETQAIKAALYIRVSTDRQVEEGDSLEEQENELRKYCDYRNFRIHKIYREKGKSGGNTNRPEYQAMLKDIQDKTINTLIVKKIDRLSRSLFDFEALMEIMHTNKVEFISIRENFDTTSAIGTAMLRIILVFAQLEREQTSERLRDVFSYRASQGMYNGGVRPYGYITLNKELVPYAKEKQIIETMATHFMTSKSTTETARFLNEHGYRGRNDQLWDKRRVQVILQNPIYAGKIKWYDQVFQGLHMPLITEAKFDHIQDLFNHPRINQSSKAEALLKRVLFCGQCNIPMTPSFTVNRHKKRYYYYPCVSTQSAEKKKSSCHYKYVAFSLADQGTLEALLSLLDTKPFETFEMQVSQHNRAIDSKVAVLKEDQATIELQLHTVKTKKDHFLDSLISSKFLSTERSTIQGRVSELEAEEKQYKSQLSKLEFAITQEDSQKLDALGLKQFLVLFKAEYYTFTPKKLQEKVRLLVDKVFYHPNHLDIHLRGFPWPLKQSPSIQMRESRHEPLKRQNGVYTLKTTKIQ